MQLVRKQWDTLVHLGPKEAVRLRREASVAEAHQALEQQRQERKARLQ